METVNCNLCGSGEYRFVYSKPDHHYFGDEWFNVVECTNCGLGFVNPRPTYEEIFRYYPETFYEYGDQPDRYQKEAGYVLAVAKGTGSLLDVGCANGEFPRYMKSLGWEVEGVEVSPNAKRITDFKVYEEEFPRIPVNEPRYDAVTAWAVLEHLHDPMAYFKKTSVVLRPGGAFAFFVPNFSSISSRNLFLEDVPRHLYFYTEETIKRYLSDVGLKLVKAEYSNNLFQMSPVNWLRYYVHRYLKRRPFEWNDIPKSRMKFLSEKKLEPNLLSNVAYALSTPLTVIDRALMPLYERYQIISKKHGSVTYVAIKP